MSSYLWGFGYMRDVSVKCLFHYWTYENSIFIANWVISVTKEENGLLAYSDEIISFKIFIFLSSSPLLQWRPSQYLHELTNERSPDSFPCWRRLLKRNSTMSLCFLEMFTHSPLPSEWSLNALALLFIIWSLILILPSSSFMLLGYGNLSSLFW